MKKKIMYLIMLTSLRAAAQQTLEKGIQTLTLTGATLKNTILEITGTGVIQNNKAVSPSETTLEEIDMNVAITVSSFDNNGTFKYGIGRQANLAGTYIEITGNSTTSKVIVNRMDYSSVIFVKEYELPFLITPGELCTIRLGKRLRTLIVEVTRGHDHFITDSLKYPVPFFGLQWGTPFIACANGTISISDYQLSTPFNLSPRLAVFGDSFIEGNALDNEKQRYVSFVKDSIGYENIAISGKGGESSGSISNRLSTETRWFRGCTYALLAIGVNDVNFDTWKANMLKHIELLKGKGIIPVITTLTPREDRCEFILAANDWIRTGYNGAYIDISRVVSTDDITWLPGTSMPDKVHPTAASHVKIFYRLAEEAPYLFRNSRAFTIDYKNETTSEKVNNSIEYSGLSNFSTAESGLNNVIPLLPGKNFYFRSVAPDKIKFLYDVLLVPNRPNPPVGSTKNTTGSFDWINTPGFTSVMDYEFSLDNGTTWKTCYEKPIKNSSVEYIDLRVKAGAKNFKSLPLRIDRTTAITSTKLTSIQIYPNPVNNKLTLDNLTCEALASVYASDGRLVKTALLTAGSNTIPLEVFPEGIYMLVITSNSGENRVVKFLKKDE
jgi:lysophospholipase L1-like esterase